MMRPNKNGRANRRLAPPLDEGRLPRTFRFYEPFREFKHGKTEAVAKLEGELYDLVDEIIWRAARR